MNYIKYGVGNESGILGVILHVSVLSGSVGQCTVGRDWASWCDGVVGSIFPSVSFR